MTKSVLIVEDIAEARAWLALMVQRAFGTVETRSAATLAEALPLCAGGAGQAFDLALVDLGLPDGSGLDVLRALRRNRPDTLTIVTTVMARDSDIVGALSAGAQGYLLKGGADDVLIRQLRQHAEGIPALSPPVARRIMQHFRLTGPAAEPDETLTARELDVLKMIARGFRVVDAANSLGLAESTVASHIKSIYRKLDINSRAEATLHATRMGLMQ